MLGSILRVKGCVIPFVTCVSPLKSGLELFYCYLYGVAVTSMVLILRLWFRMLLFVVFCRMLLFVADMKASVQCPLPSPCVAPS